MSHQRYRFTVSSAVIALAGLVAGVFIAWASVRAENLLRISTAEANAGDTGVQLLVTARNDEPVHSFSLAITFPADVFTMTDFSLEGTPLAELEPAFAAPNIDNELGFGTFGLVFELDGATGEKFLEPRELTDTERVIARLTFTVRAGAEGGTYPIRLTQGVGLSAVVNEFSNAGNSIEPTLIDGAILVGGEHIMAADRISANCVSDRAQAAPVRFTVRGQNSVPIDGVSVVLEYACVHLFGFDPEENENDAVIGAGIAEDVGSEIAEGQVEFYSSHVAEIGRGLCRSITGLLFDRFEPLQGQQLLASENGVDQELMAYNFNINYNTNIIPCETTEKIDFRLVQDPIPVVAPANNSFAIDAFSVLPRVYHGSIYFCTGALRGGVIDGATGQPLEGAKIQIEPEYRETTSSAAGTWSFLDLPPGEYLVRLTKDDYYTGIIPEFVVRCGTINDNDLGEFTLHPSAPINGGGGLWIKTFDTNQDGRHDIADVFPVVRYFFLGKIEPAIHCLDALEANGDGRLDLSDAIYFLRYLFNGGDLPIAPFPDCGQREESIAGCNQFSACAQNAN